MEHPVTVKTPVTHIISQQDPHHPTNQKTMRQHISQQLRHQPHYRAIRSQDTSSAVKGLGLKMFRPIGEIPQIT